MTRTAVFDGHNDLLLRLLAGNVTPEQVADGLPDGHIDLPRAVKGGFAGGMFAIFVPSVGEGIDHAAMTKPPYDLPLPDRVDETTAAAFVERGLDRLQALETAGAVSLCRTAGEIEDTLTADQMAAVAHIEGAEGVDRDFARLHDWHARGLRSLGPVWSRDTVWGYGVPFRYPSDGDIGPGLTDAGKALIRECNHLKIMVDLSHLNVKGMEDVANITSHPLVATHSNAHAICPHARNLTDRQLHMIRDSDGMVGLNFASAFLRPDGKMDADFSIDVMLQHLDHMIDLLGETRVGLGSDFDGALVPAPIKDCAGLPVLIDAMQARYGAVLTEQIAHGNWIRVLRQTWGV
ncbi:dipeptidase [Sagittula sp. SSi028]|uniref:dipeptidase n=1 Tax=Sagittula sp. SSi028 TaxID=3400636 RepID=UPI003AF63ED5